MKVIKREKRKYYKYTTTLNPQITQNGGTYNAGLFSTSADNQYLRLPILPLGSADSWEVQLVYTHNSGGSYPTLIGSVTGAYGLAFIINSGEFFISLCPDAAGTPANRIASTSIGLSAVVGTTYYFKIGFNGSLYYIDYNTDASDAYTRQWSTSSSVKIYSSDALCIGYWMLTNVTRWAQGPFDMTKFRVYVNNRLYLAGTEVAESTEDDYDYYKDVNVCEIIDGGIQTVRKYYKWGSLNASVTGTLTNNDGVVSGFSKYNYLSLPQQFKPNTDTWDIVFKFIDIGENVGQYVFSSGYFGASQYVTNVNLVLNQGAAGNIKAALGWGSGNNYTFLAASMATTGAQYAKFTYDGTKYAAYVSNTSTFGDVPDATYNSSTPVNQTYVQPDTRIGMFHDGYSGVACKIDLKESYIKIGGETWWTGYTIVEGTSSDYDWYEDVPQRIIKVIKS